MNPMNRRKFIAIAAISLTGSKLLAQAPAANTAAKAITDKDILKEGMPTTIANYCENPEKQPNKACPTYKEKPGNCKSCMFYNKDNSAGDFKGKKYARCQLLTDPKKPQFVAENAWCATFVKQA